ncbi:hypothetical protein BaRGS_00032100 [Batillaria attramentaria]|uniref:Uncharacterized protein n=1 Tax=Batillaria attramentaria TaxID=370345 RepID=A0ABD0JQE4_9CAEN
MRETTSVNQQIEAFSLLPESPPPSPQPTPRLRFFFPPCPIPPSPPPNLPDLNFSYIAEVLRSTSYGQLHHLTFGSLVFFFYSTVFPIPLHAGAPSINFHPTTYRVRPHDVPLDVPTIYPPLLRDDPFSTPLLRPQDVPLVDDPSDLPLDAPRSSTPPPITCDSVIYA